MRITNGVDFAVPVKYEQVVFCGLSDFQLALYQLFITSPDIKALLRGKESQPLKAINVLKKLCNHPELLDLPSDLQGSESLIPAGFVGAKERLTGGSGKGGSGPGVNCEWSGKFVVLERQVARAWAMKVVLTLHEENQVFAPHQDGDQRQDCSYKQLYSDAGHV